MSQVGSAARTLDATNNRLTSLPAYLSSLTSLQRLIVASNQLAALPRDISALTSLKVPSYASPGQWQMHAMRAHCGSMGRMLLAALEVIGGFLIYVGQVLVLDSNRLTELPAEIGTLTKLEKLCVSENALTGLPPTFGRLQSLTVLKLVKNKLSAVPDQIGECTSLEEIDVSDNYLQVQIPPVEHSVQPYKCLQGCKNIRKRLGVMSQLHTWELVAQCTDGNLYGMRPGVARVFGQPQQAEDPGS